MLVRVLLPLDFDVAEEVRLEPRRPPPDRVSDRGGRRRLGSRDRRGMRAPSALLATSVHALDLRAIVRRVPDGQQRAHSRGVSDLFAQGAHGRRRSVFTDDVRTDLPPYRRFVGLQQSSMIVVTAVTLLPYPIPKASTWEPHGGRSTYRPFVARSSPSRSKTWSPIWSWSRTTLPRTSSIARWTRHCACVAA